MEGPLGVGEEWGAGDDVFLSLDQNYAGNMVGGLFKYSSSLDKNPIQILKINLKIQQ